MPLQMIGLTGGIGSGKSMVLNILKERFDAKIIQTDEVAKSLEEPGMPGYIELISAFGDEILSPDKTIDKQKFSQMIFSNPEVLMQVNRIIHPLTWKECEKQARSFDGTYSIIESALILQALDLFDEIWYVYAEKEVRIKRLMKDRGYSREKCESIIASQPSPKDYYQNADFIIDNNGTRADVIKQLEEHLSKY